MTVQDKVRKLCSQATPTTQLRRWVRGYIPRHYKRLTCPMDVAIELAERGATESITAFNTKPYFTQSLLIGAFLDGRYKTIVVVTPSQYGKSWTCGQIALLSGNAGHRTRVAGGDEKTTQIIMDNVLLHLQNAHPDIQKKVLDYGDRIEKLQSSVTKKRLTFQGGGLIESVTLGASVNDSKKYNKAIGRGGVYIVDEAAMIPEDAFAEIGRREFSSIDGEKEPLFMISNPHQTGHFYDALTEENPPEDTLIVWMDVRTSLEEGRIPSVKRVVESDFFKNSSTCQRYFLCELEDYSETSMFPPCKTKDFNSIEELSNIPGITFFLGIDSAYKGKDNLDMCLGAEDSAGNIYVLDIATLQTKKWVDGETSERIIRQILAVVAQFHVRYISVDIGWGVYLVEGLAKHSSRYDFTVEGVNFGSGASKDRIKARHYSAKYASNMRSELHMDLQSVMSTGHVYFTTGVKKLVEPQMQAVRTCVKGGGKFGIIPKSQIKASIGKSPDELDSVLLMIHSVVRYNIGTRDISLAQTNYHEHADLTARG